MKSKDDRNQMKLRYRLASAYLRLGRPLLTLTRWLRGPMRVLFRLTPTLAHDRRPRWKPYLLRWCHELFVGELPSDFRIHRGELAFRSTGSEMSLHGYYVGEIEDHLIRWIQTQLKPQFVMVDIGAHHGAFTLVVAHELRKRGWSGKIHAFEPDAGNFAILTYNIRQNKLEDYVQLNRKAVAATDGTVSFLTNLAENSDNRLAAVGAPAGGAQGVPLGMAESRVAAVSLDTIGSTLPSLDLIKMDTQGAEFEVLTGGQTILKRHRPALLIELLSGVDDDSAIRAMLDHLGYEVHGVTREGELCGFGAPAAYISWDCCCLQRRAEGPVKRT